MYGLTGDYFRSLMQHAGRSDLNVTGVSDFMRCMREIQSVACQLCFSFDHTFAMLKNYQYFSRNSSSNKTAAAATCVTERGELPFVAIVRNTKIAEASHAIQSFASRPTVHPKVMSTDTWPSNTIYWKAVFPLVAGCFRRF